MLAVIFYHGSSSQDSLAYHGQKGVLVFFAISGYLITLRLLDDTGVDGAINFKGFYGRRFFRILPPAYVYLAVIVLLSWWQVIEPVHGSELAAAVLFVRNTFPATGESLWYTSHFWSLAVEEQFYLFWPWIMSWGERRARRFCLLFVLAFGAWRALAHYPASHVRLPACVARSTFDFIVWGAWWALFLRSDLWRARVHRILTVPVWFGVLALITAISYFEPLGATSALAAIIPILIVGTVLRPESAVGRLLELSWLCWIGRLSYGLYIWQQLFFVRYMAIPPATFQTFPANVLLLLGIATLSYYAWERPLLRFGRRWMEGDGAQRVQRA